MSPKTRSINLSITEQDKLQLEQLARDMGKTWGESPSISQLVKAIARRQFLITPNNDWIPARIKSLITAQELLIDTGKIEDARIITELLLSRSELTIPQRSVLQQFLNNPPHPWRLTLDQKIHSNTPFRLAYYHASDRPFTFNIHRAEITLIEKRLYLQCWCEETEGSQDLPELAHNRSLRLDRIPEAAISPLKAKWRAGLDTIEVEFYLYKGLAFAYSSKPKDDILNEPLAQNPPARRIIRRINSTFWFFREIFPYGEDCEIISPPEIREQFRQKVQALSDRYNP